MSRLQVGTRAASVSCMSKSSRSDARSSPRRRRSWKRLATLRPSSGCSDPSSADRRRQVLPANRPGRLPELQVRAQHRRRPARQARGAVAAGSGGQGGEPCRRPANLWLRQALAGETSARKPRVMNDASLRARRIGQPEKAKSERKRRARRAGLLESCWRMPAPKASGNDLDDADEAWRPRVATRGAASPQRPGRAQAPDRRDRTPLGEDRRGPDQPDQGRLASNAFQPRLDTLAPDPARPPIGAECSRHAEPAGKP